MLIFPVADFARQGSAQLPNGNWTHVGIAPSSVVDICDVDGLTLGPCALVPVRPGGGKVTAIRGYRTGAIVGGANYEQFTSLVLVLFEACDDVFVPGPRSAAFRSAQPLNLAPGTDVLALRLPFSGRKQAVIAARRQDGDTADANIIIRGIRYHSPASIKTMLVGGGGDPTQFPFLEVAATETLFNGAASLPTSALGGVENMPIGRVFYVGGGGDFQEGFDELEVWLTTTGAAGVMYVQGEASGERG